MENLREGMILKANLIRGKGLFISIYHCKGFPRSMRMNLIRGKGLKVGRKEMGWARVNPS